MTDDTEDEYPKLIQDIEDAAETVHSRLGNGYTETIYHSALLRELSERGIGFTSEPTLTVMYKGVAVGRRRPDLIVTPEYGGIVVLELKAGSTSGDSQLRQYLDICRDSDTYTDVSGGLLIQFNSDCQTYYYDET
jgi:GxxExxY protein